MSSLGFRCVSSEAFKNSDILVSECLGVAAAADFVHAQRGSADNLQSVSQGFVFSTLLQLVKLPLLLSAVLGSCRCGS